MKENKIEPLDSQQPDQHLRSSLVVVMAIAIGVISADQYYLQPLLNHVRSDFRASTTSTTLLLAIIQVGYASGLAFVVPLGDLWPRRRLIVSIFLAAALAMATASFMYALALFAAATLLIGLASVGGQLLLPLGADLAPRHERGRVLGRLMTGLIGGILLSRTLSGLLYEAIGWRGVYRIAASMLVVMSLILLRVLPDEVKRPHQSYRLLIGGGLDLMRGSALIRQRCWLGGPSSVR